MDSINSFKLHHQFLFKSLDKKRKWLPLPAKIAKIARVKHTTRVTGAKSKFAGYTVTREPIRVQANTAMGQQRALHAMAETKISHFARRAPTSMTKRWMKRLMRLMRRHMLVQTTVQTTVQSAQLSRMPHLTWVTWRLCLTCATRFHVLHVHALNAAKLMTSSSSPTVLTMPLAHA